MCCYVWCAGVCVSTAAAGGGGLGDTWPAAQALAALSVGCRGALGAVMCGVLVCVFQLLQLALVIWGTPGRQRRRWLHCRWVAKGVIGAVMCGVLVCAVAGGLGDTWGAGCTAGGLQGRVRCCDVWCACGMWLSSSIRRWRSRGHMAGCAGTGYTASGLQRRVRCCYVGLLCGDAMACMVAVIMMMLISAVFPVC
jgi:hypothetical protein